MKTDYNKVVERKDVTVKNMLNMYKSHPRFKSTLKTLKHLRTVFTSYYLRFIYS